MNFAVSAENTALRRKENRTVVQAAATLFQHGAENVDIRRVGECRYLGKQPAVELTGNLFRFVQRVTVVPQFREDHQVGAASGCLSSLCLNCLPVDSGISSF